MMTLRTKNFFLFNLISLLILTLLSTTASSKLGYDEAIIYNYDYSFDTMVKDLSREEALPVGLNFTSKLIIKPVWLSLDKTSILFQANLNNILVVNLQTENSNSNGFSSQNSHIQDLLSPVFFFKITSGESQGIWFKENSSNTYKNIAKGIANLFQFRLKSHQSAETSLFGVCPTQYQLLSSPHDDGTISVVTKNINLNECKASNLGFNGQWSDTNRALSPRQNSSSQTTYTIKAGVVQSALSQDYHLLKLLGRKIDTTASSKQLLELESTSDDKNMNEYKTEIDAIQAIDSENKAKWVQEGIEYSVPLLSKRNNIKLRDVIDDKMQYLTSKENNEKVTENFLYLVQAFRSASSSEILKILQDENLEEIKYPLVEIATAAQTDEAQGALMAYLEFEYPPEAFLIERYLVALSISIHPTRKMLEDVLSVVQMNLPDKSIHETATLSLASLLFTYSQNNPTFKQDKLFDEIKEFLVNKVQKTLDDEDAVQIYLLALSNAGLSDFVPLATNLAEKGSTFKIQVAAIQIFKRLPVHQLEGKIRKTLLRIYFQTNSDYDDTVRIAAASIIISKEPSKQEIINFALSLADEKRQEIRKFMTSALNLMAKRNKEFNLPYSVKSILAEVFRHHLKSSNFEALKTIIGFSRAIKTQIADVEGEVLSSFSLDLEYTKSGTTRRSTFNLAIQAGDRSVDILTIGLYAEGLLSIIGGDDDDTAASPRAIATLGLMDTTLRPYQLFYGQAELLGVVMSTGGGEMNILSTQILLMDHMQQVVVGSGMNLNMKIAGALTLGLAGNIEMSLWSRNSNTDVINRAAVVIQGTTEISLDEIQFGQTITVSGVTRVDFTTTVEFSGIPMKMCLRMGRQDLLARLSSRSYEKVGTNRTYYKTYGRKQALPGETYIMDDEVSQTCKEMLEY